MLSVPELYVVVTKLLVLINTLFGLSEDNRDEAVERWEKVAALVKLAQTGNDRDCHKVLATIRKKRAEREDFLTKLRKERGELEAGIRDKQAMMRLRGAPVG